MDTTPTPDQMQDILKAKFLETMNNTSSVLEGNRALIKKKQDELFGNPSNNLSNLSPDQQVKINNIITMLSQYPVIIDPLLSFGATLVKAEQENQAAIAANPTLIKDINDLLKSKGAIPNG